MTEWINIEEFGSCSGIHFLTHDGIKTMEAGKKYDKNLNEIRRDHVHALDGYETYKIKEKSVSRKWDELHNDEIYAIWKEYLRTEGLGRCDILQLCTVKSKPMRLTPMEIIRLVEELLDRLEIKDNKT